MMDKFNQIEWRNPREKIWGFHVHQKLPMYNDYLFDLEKLCKYLGSHNPN